MSRFASSSEEAHARFEVYRSKDPFPDILPALLNSADISDYVAVTGMLFPFGDGAAVGLKSASYEMPLIGDFIYWDGNGKKHSGHLGNEPNDAKELILEPNSIAFVSPEAEFRLPDYIALRFNLRIQLVHRGLLLGTGPLVDPGFEGRLTIPLHNLTTNAYHLPAGSGMIWVEFTKLSANARWSGDPPTPPLERSGEYIPFPPSKKLRTMDEYLFKASPHEPIRSSIPDAIQDARQAADEAAQSAKDAQGKAEGVQNTLRTISFWAGVLVVGTIATILLNTYNLIQGATKYIRDGQAELAKTQLELQQTRRDLDQLKEDHKRLSAMQDRQLKARPSPIAVSPRPSDSR